MWFDGIENKKIKNFKQIACGYLICTYFRQQNYVIHKAKKRIKKERNWAVKRNCNWHTTSGLNARGKNYKDVGKTNVSSKFKHAPKRGNISVYI